MKKYQGTKCVEAEPMTLGDYKQLTGRDPYANIGSDVSDIAAGYHVRYKDGYTSWSPAAAFEEAYKPCETFLDRLRIEKAELSDRINKLDAFIEHNPKFAELGQDDRDMLRSQYEAMRIYEHILIDRIAKAQQ